ncbi:uncharacterized protein LOC130703676 [Daphnia carinata]|uniref:uncharacterized protein LOC130703676 n=1 Tax=Daphnia carinata TaxID=120202 RepID=UPI0025809064|nr:uncharacterized protein LOC130703676 [Daphnia carinata]
MEAQCTNSSVNTQLRSTIAHLRDQLDQCKRQVLELNSLQGDFRAKLVVLLRKMEKENILQQRVTPCGVTLTDTETQTCELLPRRWNSDLSLDLDGKSNGKRYQRVERSDLASLCISSEAIVAPPIIRQPQQKKTYKSKFTNRLDVGNHSIGKHQVDNLLLSDLGLTSQAPDFSQSEFNLSSDDHWLKENQKHLGGRVRFLSHEDNPGGFNDNEEDLEDMKDMPQQSQIFHSHSGSWATLTHSERDLSELDSCLSLNYQERTEPKFFTSSTPYKNLRSKFKQSVSFHDLLPSKATQSMPNLQKQNHSAGEVSNSNSRRTLPLSINTDIANSNKRHSLTNMEQRPHNFTPGRRSSLTGDIENGPYVPSAISSLFLGGRVKALHGGHLVVTGVVWYRGKLPGITEDIVGIEIDQVGLGGDGTFQGHRYFRCAPGRGLFVPFRKIIMAWPTHPQ